MMGPAYNAFAYEGSGIQTYFTAPLRFSDIFAGKNLVSAAMIAFEVALCGVVLAWAIWFSLSADAVGHHLCAHFYGKRTIANSQLGFAEFSTQTGIRFHAQPKKFRRIGVDYVRRADRSCRNFGAGVVEGSMVRQSLAARGRFCVFGGGRVRRIFCVPAAASRISPRKRKKF